ncbi:histone-lysine N-methyltransferase NSD3 [Notechis scutatus]|uniref:Histone-lysine N-methyltransferase NSD3 n=1 Tax=Notechis scutatus TaxID=8663 RepID=A0A6J1V121_9SAUR|nr:histone-lysine N-methyltransferase NSD3 [Notechis scutatus]
MDFSFSFMQGIMGNTIQQPPQLIDSANNRQEDAFDAHSDITEDGRQTPYEAALALQQGFQYPTPTAEDLPPLINGFPQIGMYEPQAKFQSFSQYPNGSANGFGTVRNFSPPEYYHMENSNLRPHDLLEKPSPPQPPPPSVSQTVIPKKTGSPEIKLKITKTIQNGRELFESSLCGDLLNEVQASEFAKSKHEGRKEKRKKSSKHDAAHSEERKSRKIPKLEPEEQNRPNERLSIQSEKPREEMATLDETPAQQVAASLSVQETSDCKFEVGDLVWSKVGTYPWWPCMVSRDPQLEVHTKINTRGAREYHVQFFSNQPERAWVHEKRVREYKGRKQYDQLVAEAAKQANHSEKQKIRKPRPQRERAQWDIGIAHAEKALKMSLEERIEQYTFIYVDKEPEEVSSKAKRIVMPKIEAKKIRKIKSPPNSPPEQTNDVLAAPSPPKTEVRRYSQRRQCSADEESPPVKIQWKTAAARKSLPASITMHKGTLDLQKCNMSPVVKIEQVFALQNAAGNGKFIDQFVYSAKGIGNKPEIIIKGHDKVTSVSIPRTERASSQSAPSPETSSGLASSVEKKQQRRSIRTRSESEKSTEVVPKKKIKKEQVETAPQAAVKTGLQKGASEISDSCKPLKKRSRASTDVELANSAYRDTSDSDSRGLNDLQGSFGKQSDSPLAAADADASDVQSVDSSLSRRGSGTNKRDTVCQICESTGESLVSCEGECYRVFHTECLGLSSQSDGKFICLECKNGQHICFSCKLPGKDVKRCSVNACGKFYHEACVRKFTTAVFESRGFRCPQHCCTACSMDKDIHKASKGRMVRCLRCPIAYHSGDGCIAAGSLFVSSHILICSNHSKRSNHSSSAVNVGFCFVCARGLIVQDHSDPLFSSYANKSHYLLNESNRAELMKLPMIPPSSSASKKKCEKGGKLLCCESCPASFHPECLNIEMPGGSWNCNDCKSGKKLRYKQIVWVKLGNYRWWPAEICNPRSVPFNIQGLKHDVGDFPVFFFGSHDYYWVHQGRVFPYVEGDKSFAEGQTNINKTFKKETHYLEFTGMELTFNYNLDCLGNGRTECHCGAENCSGFLGVRPKTACATANEEKAKNAKLKQKKRKIKTEQKQMHEDNCFQCGDGGELVMCDKKDCPKAYHLLCLNLTQPPFGKWECPWHQCVICGNPAASFCEFCPHSYCKDHEKGALVSSALDGRLCCSEHNPKAPVAPEYWGKIKRRLEQQNPDETSKE